MLFQIERCQHFHYFVWRHQHLFRCKYLFSLLLLCSKIIQISTTNLFQGVMVRLMLVLAPVMCVLSGITISHLLSKYIKSVDTSAALSSATSSSTAKDAKDRKSKKLENQSGVKNEIAIAFVGLLTFMLISYTFHCTWVTSEAYSSPSIVLSARSHDGGRIIFDDFREAYYWLKMNTPEVS